MRPPRQCRAAISCRPKKARIGTVVYIRRSRRREEGGRALGYLFGRLGLTRNGHRTAGIRRRKQDVDALGNSANQPKPVRAIATNAPVELEKIVTRQNMADHKLALEELKEESESGKLSVAMPAG